MGTIVVADQPCPKCDSKQGWKIYDDGSAYCYAADCGHYERPGHFDLDGNVRDKTGDAPRAPVSPKELRPPFNPDAFKSHAIRDRKISKEVAAFYKVTLAFNEDGDITHHHYPYALDTCFKVRRVADKNFYWANGKSSNLFGIDRFQPGGKRLVITEGEIDCLSVAQASFEHYNKFYPVVALSSSSIAHKSSMAHREFIRSFDEVVIMMDEDEAGAEAVSELLKVIGYDKARKVKLPLNDASDVLRNLGAKALMQSVFDAARITPAGILTGDQVWKQLVEYNSRKSIPYPPCIGGVNAKTKGKRGGEIALFISGTSTGKSTVLREDLIHTLEITDDMVGVVSLEEAPAETGRKLAGMAINRNPAYEEIPIEDLKQGFDELWKDDRIVLLDHQGSIDDEGIVDKLEYMILLGCKHIYLDHITILVSEGAGDLTGNEAIDKVMNDLLRLVKKYPEVWIGLISHLRKASFGGKSFEEGRMPSLDDIKGCLALNTKVLLYNGSKIPVQDVDVGMQLMGDDGTPRNVLRLARGEQQMYRISMKTSKDSFICNEDHVLTLSHNNRIFDISVKEFLEKSANYQERCKMHYSSGYELPKRELLIPPYAFGAWLGDGSKSAFRIMDASELGIAQRVADEIEAKISWPNNRKREYVNFITNEKGEMLEKLRSLNVLNNKHIPVQYRYSSIEDRLQLLAGLLDTDGSYSNRDENFYFYQKDYKLASDVRDIARSLGLYSNLRAQTIKGAYSSNGTIIYQVMISGNISKIPCQKSNKVLRACDALKRGIIVEKLDKQPYYGFVLDGNSRFLLGNHIITHNSGSIKQISFDVIGFARNLMAETVEEKNTMQFSVLKCRYTGLTGMAGAATYKIATGRLYPVDTQVTSFD
jgi:twinkle protein